VTILCIGKEIVRRRLDSPTSLVGRDSEDDKTDTHCISPLTFLLSNQNIPSEIFNLGKVAFDTKYSQNFAIIYYEMILRVMRPLVK
jgi:hypothetical protein